jgi:hypothetical protein
MSASSDGFVGGGSILHVEKKLIEGSTELLPAYRDGPDLGCEIDEDIS